MKFLVISLVTIGIGLITYYFLSSKDYDACREIAYQNSELYGELPRRYYEITDLSSYKNWRSLSFFVTFNCSPVMIIKVSKFSCSTLDTRVPLEQESYSLLKLVKGCQTDR
jgi:hypothetical protein